MRELWQTGLKHSCGWAQCVFQAVLQQILIQRTESQAHLLSFYRFLAAASLCISQALDTNLHAQGHLTIGGTATEVAYAFVQLTDGSYILAGSTHSFGQGLSDVYVAKVDASGTLLWAKTFGGASNEGIWGIVATSDGGCALAGYTQSFGAGGYDVYVLKLDANGNLQWSRTIGGPSDEFGYGIIQTTDGGYLVVGETWSFGPGSASIYAIKLDASGNQEWTRVIGGTAQDYARGALQTADGGYLIAGTSWSFGPGQYDIFLVKLDIGGNFLWSRGIGTADGDEFASAMIALRDPPAGYAIIGTTTAFGQGEDFYILRLKPSGIPRWAIPLGGANTDLGLAIAQSAEGGLLAVGYTESFGQAPGNGDVYVAHLDSLGNLQWSKILGGTGADVGRSVLATLDDGYAIAGYTESYGQGTSDMYLLKLDAQGNFSPSICPEIIQNGGTTGTNTWTSILYTPTITANEGTIASPSEVSGSGGLSTQCGTLCTIDTSVLQQGDTLIAVTTSATYQWLDCSAGFQAIAGATHRAFIPTTAGWYAVAITKGGCTDTSECHHLIPTALEQTSLGFARPFTIHFHTGEWLLRPSNPTSIQHVTLYSLEGRQLWTQEQINGPEIRIPQPRVRGLYLMEIGTEERIWRIWVRK